MTELTPTKLIAVVVPEEMQFVVKNYGYAGKWLEESNGTGLNAWKISFKGKQFIGTITKASVFDFDAGKYIEKKEVSSYTYEGICYVDIYRNYMEEERMYLLSCDQCHNEKESFLSLLESNGVYLNNPIVKPNGNSDFYKQSDVRESGMYDIDLKEWQSYESKTVPHGSKLLIIEKL